MARQRNGTVVAGFTLIEVLVALAILAIGLGFAFRAMSGSFLRLSRSGADQSMVQVAESLLARVGRDIPLEHGLTEGKTGDGLFWRIEMAPYGNTNHAAPGQLVGEEVAVTVGRTLDGSSRHLRLVTLRLGLKGAGL